MMYNLYVVRIGSIRTTPAPGWPRTWPRTPRTGGWYWGGLSGSVCWFPSVCPPSWRPSFPLPVASWWTWRHIPLASLCACTFWLLQIGRWNDKERNNYSISVWFTKEGHWTTLKRYLYAFSRYWGHHDKGIESPIIGRGWVDWGLYIDYK